MIYRIDQTDRYAALVISGPFQQISVSSYPNSYEGITTIFRPWLDSCIIGWNLMARNRTLYEIWITIENQLVKWTPGTPFTNMD